MWCCWNQITCRKHQRYLEKYRYQQQNEDENKGRAKITFETDNHQKCHLLAGKKYLHSLKSSQTATEIIQCGSRILQKGKYKYTVWI